MGKRDVYMRGSKGDANWGNLGEMATRLIYIRILYATACFEENSALRCRKNLQNVNNFAVADGAPAAPAPMYPLRQNTPAPAA